MKRDFYNDGYNDGYGKPIDGEREFPESDIDKHSWEQGLKDGQRRRRISNELDREGY